MDRRLVHSPSAHTQRATVRAVVETYAERMAKPRRMLLLASYCGGDTVQCSDDHPCADCLADCNTFMISRDALDAADYAGTLPGIVQGEKPLKKRLPVGWEVRLRESVGASRRVSAAVLEAITANSVGTSAASAPSSPNPGASNEG